MLSKILIYGLVGALAVALIGGTVYILARPAEVVASENYGQGGPAGHSLGTGTAAEGSGRGYRGGAEGQGARGEANRVTNLPAAVTAPLTEQETAGLLAMREEEKLAHDVYVTLYQAWGQPTFQSIAASEQTHMDALKTLLERYGVADPVAELETGVFATPAMQELYNQLVAQGQRSLADALQVGAAVEERDILDLEQVAAQTTHTDLQQVYANLRAGSSNHLRAFAGAWERQTGATYQPQSLSQAAYESLMTSTTGRGGGYRGGQGSGNGNAGRP